MRRDRMKRPHDRSAARRAILRQWMQEHERAPAWVARKVGYTREYVALVLSGRYPFTDKLVQACTAALRIEFGSVGIATDKHREPLSTATAR
jgi:hypothetical protein